MSRTKDSFGQGSKQEQNVFFIPPLPKSSTVDKENSASQSRKSSPRKSLKENTRDLVPLGNISFSSQASTREQSRLPLHSPQRTRGTYPVSFAPTKGGIDNSLSTPSSRPSVPTTNSSTSRRILRYQESVESLFCLSNNCTEEHRSLCKEIANGALADSSAAWRRALEVAKEEVRKRCDSEHSENAGNDLLRLHRRATSRFSLDNVKKHKEDNILAIWISYAKVQAKFGHVEDARMTYRHIRNHGVGTKDAAYYIAVAKIECNNNIEFAREALQLGISSNAEPRDELKKALETINRNRRSINTKGAVCNSTSTHKETSQETGVHGSVFKTADPSPRKRNAESDISPTRIYRKTNTSPKTEAKPSGNLVNEARDSILRCDDTSENPTVEHVSHKSSACDTTTKRLPTDADKARRRLLLTKTPKLLRLGLSGRAQRINPENDVVDDDRSNDSIENVLSRSKKSESEPSGIKLKEKQSEPTGVKAKFKKLDLDYMWNWDPNSRRLQTSQSPKGFTTEAGKEEMSNTDSTSSMTLTKNLEVTTQQSHVEVNSRSSIKSENHAPAERPSKDLSPEIVQIVERSNPDFLPLVGEDNIVRVNGVPYMKLGVVGKGGSSKVYRALSKECSVLAIKRVKINGMDRKAIDGYANEISLLKRLRGNPAIIQMFDSEVDMTRKVILVVMEAGEVDLNQVLQQQTAKHGQSNTTKRRSLNMNFIRLTWQQMLSAVHCIHEERIIHGDLKPANFLFVRGALKLIDFGIAKAIQSDDTTNIYRESQIGTLNYMSPEAILDTGTGSNGARMKIGRASDIWSLGCILYQMVYGKTPFASMHMIQKLQAIIDPNHKIVFPDPVDCAALDVMKKCLRRKAHERPPIVGRDGLLNEHIFLNSSNS